MKGEQLDLSTDGPVDSTAAPSQPESTPEVARRFLGIQFACCGVYSRVYVNSAGDAYEGRCPRCMRAVTIAIGPGGSNQRFFTAY